MNFYNLLNNDDHDIIEDSDEQCLITQDSLNLNYVTLECNHKFNFLPLYFEIKKQKTMKNLFEITNLKLNEIKCPYCRSITDKLLPYRDISGVEYIRGVNYPSKYCIKIHSCEWVFKNGKQKNMKCNNSAFETSYGCFCNKHINLINKSKKLENDKKYTVVQLKEILKKLNMKISGNKTELIERLISVNYNFN